MRNLAIRTMQRDLCKRRPPWPNPPIAARLKPVRRGYLAQCGQDTCRAPLGFAQRPTPEESHCTDYAYVGTLTPEDAAYRAHPHRDWLFHAPASREISAAEGFSPDHDETVRVFFTIIRPQPERDAAGRPVLDQDGQPVLRRRGRTPVPAKHDLMYLNHAILGEKPALPALVQCAECCRLNHVPRPEGR